MSSLPFTEFTADGFRGLRSLEVKDLRGINVFVGGNNSGKTSVLEALAILSNPTSGMEWVQVVRRRDYGRLDESLIVSLRWCFANPDSAAFVRAFAFDDDEVELDAEEEEEEEEEEQEEDGEDRKACHFTALGSLPIRAVHSQFVAKTTITAERAELDPPDLFGENEEVVELVSRECEITNFLKWDDSNSSAGLPRKSSRVRMDDRGQIALGGMKARSSLVQTTKQGLSFAVLLPYSYQLNSLQVAARSSLLFQDDNTLLLDLLRQFDSDVVNVEVASFFGTRPAIYVKHRSLGVAPLSVFGDAMRRCLLLAATLAQLGKGGVLLLDEVEVGVHVDSLPKVFSWLAKSARMLGVQVFATTHSLEVLDALLAAEVGEQDLAAYQIKQGDERTECRRFSFESLKRLRYERGLDIR